jgi:hypothetical protein
MRRAIESCAYRYDVQWDGGGEIARCRFVDHVLGTGQSGQPVGRDACEHCCCCHAPSPDRLNPVVASLLYDVASRIAAARGVSVRTAAKAAAIRDWAIRELDTVSLQRASQPSQECIQEVLAPRQRIDAKIKVSCFTAHVERSEPFIHLRYGDGEWYSMLGRCGRNGDGHDFFPDTLGRDLRESLDYAAGLAPHSRCYVGFSEFWDHPAVYVYLAARPWLDQIHWVGASLLPVGIRDFSTRRFLEAVRDYPGRKYLVGNASLALVARGLGCSHVVIPRVDCYLQIGRAERACAFHGPGIVLCCAGMASEGLLVRLHRKNPSGTYIDCGHIFDAMVGVLSREYTLENSGGIVDFLFENYTPMFVTNA